MAGEENAKILLGTSAERGILKEWRSERCEDGARNSVNTCAFPIITGIPGRLSSLKASSLRKNLREGR
jgi:hypothetical protein